MKPRRRNPNSKKMKQKSHLAADIIYEILLNLPVESLLRCKSVCKNWYSLISDKHFIKSHLTLSTNNLKFKHHSLFLCARFFNNPLEFCGIGQCLKVCPLSDFMFLKSHENATELETPLQLTRPARFIEIVGSCNGLVCLLVDDPAHNYRLSIYNPSTRIWREIPLYLTRIQDDYYSFGYDELSHDYKIVELVKTSWQTGIETLIYSLETGKWKNLGDFPYPYPAHACGIFLNGALHWVTDSDSPGTEMIVSLDLATETYGEVLQPVYDEGGKNYLSLGVLGECLCGLCYYDQSHADLWVMKIYGVEDSWTKLASLPYQEDWLSKYQYPVPLFISNDGKMLFQCDFDVFVIYDPKDDSSKSFDAQACIVVESLVSPFPRLGLADNNDDKNKGSCRKRKSRRRRRVCR